MKSGVEPGFLYSYDIFAHFTTRELQMKTWRDICIPRVVKNLMFCALVLSAKMMPQIILNKEMIRW